MKIPIQQIKDIANLIFSQGGYDVKDKNINISFPQPLDIKITKVNDDISIGFTSSLPKVSWKKLITLSTWIQGVTFGKDGGTLRLKYLPDIKFAYDQDAKSIFSEMPSYNFSEVQQDIEAEYGDDSERKKIATKCLQYASEWATIASQNNVDFSQADANSARKLKKECKDFVMYNFKQDEEIRYGSIFLTFLLLYVVLPVVLKFVLERIFQKLFNK
jgi:hypothetical protein